VVPLCPHSGQSTFTGSVSNDRRHLRFIWLELQEIQGSLQQALTFNYPKFPASCSWSRTNNDFKLFLFEDCIPQDLQPFFPVNSVSPFKLPWTPSIHQDSFRFRRSWMKKRNPLLLLAFSLIYNLIPSNLDLHLIMNSFKNDD
jgi:hypothetical protein